MDLIKVVSLDPGITTGYSVGLIENGSMGVISGQTKWDELGLYDELTRSKPDVVIYETFEYRNNPRQHKDRIELFSRNLIGIIHLYVQQRHANMTITDCLMYAQTPFQGKSYYSDVHLKRDRLHKPLKGGHANDAVRHLLQWYTFGPGFKYNTDGYRPLA